MPFLRDTCPICTEGFTNADDVFSTRCGHLFHFSCLNGWQSREPSCPQCRRCNPKPHKLYLHFEEKDENLGKKEVTDAVLQNDELMANFMQLQEQLTLTENSKKELETKISGEFLHLQGEYTKLSELVKEMENRLHQLFIDNENKSAQLRSKTLEIKALVTSLAACQKKVKNLKKRNKRLGCSKRLDNSFIRF